jgi:hypothetical protein
MQINKSVIEVTITEDDSNEPITLVFNMDDMLLNGYLNSITARNKIAPSKTLLRAAVADESKQELKSLLQGNGSGKKSADIAGRLIDTFADGMETTGHSDIDSNADEGMETFAVNVVGDIALKFSLDEKSHTEFINRMDASNKVQPSYNFLISSVVPGDKDALKALMQKAGWGKLAVEIASELVDAFNPQVEMTAKKRSATPMPLQATDSVS